MLPVVTDKVAWSVCQSVGLSVTIMSPAKTVERIEAPYELWTRVDPRKHVLDGVQIPHARGNFERERGGPL